MMDILECREISTLNNPLLFKSPRVSQIFYCVIYETKGRFYLDTFWVSPPSSKIVKSGYEIIEMLLFRKFMGSLGDAFGITELEFFKIKKKNFTPDD